jgi:argininosuccinate lyase
MQVTGKRLKKQNNEVTKYISSIEWDRRLVKHVTRINMAHTLSLYEAGEISSKDAVSIIQFLLSFNIDNEIDEDIHYLIERAAIKKLGIEVAGQMNLGKSRNDQVATAIRMELRESIIAVLDELLELQSSILILSRKYSGDVIPAYTHLQRAQPVLIAYHLNAYFDSISRSIDRLLTLYRRINFSPMGSAALAGTTVKIDRERVAKLLSFEGIIRNGIDAVSSRDFVLESISCMLIIAVELSRLSEEMVLWSTCEFGFIELPDELAATSSIMPQKKNPVVAEIIRARSSFPISCLVSASSILKSLPFSYNLDLQEATPELWNAFDTVKEAARMAAKMISSVKFNVKEIERMLSDGYECAAFLAEYLSTSRKIKFRISHTIVGEIVKVSLQRKYPFKRALKELLPSISKKYIAKNVSLSDAEIERLLSAKRALQMISTEGGSNPKNIQKEIRYREGILNDQRKSISLLKSRLEEGYILLERNISDFLGSKNGS